MTIHDAATREAIACLRTSPGELGRRQAHAAWPTDAAPPDPHTVGVRLLR